jgi:hypothetical protein
LHAPPADQPTALLFDVALYSLHLSFHPEKYKLEAPASESCLFEIKLTNGRQRARTSLACTAGLYERRNIKSLACTVARDSSIRTKLIARSLNPFAVSHGSACRCKRTMNINKQTMNAECARVHSVRVLTRLGSKKPLHPSLA